MSNDFVCDTETASSAFPHFWEHTIGSGHAALALRAAWQNQLLRCRKELGFKHVRFHGILSDDVGTLLCEDDKLIYSFFNADSICDFVLSIGMFPFMELSFMPLALSSGPDTVFKYKANITPPKEYAAWETLIKKIVQHWADRYGIECVSQWFFEIWNEPNLKAFWTGTQIDYFLLYRHAVKAIKEVDEKLQTGGPATASNSWIDDFTGYCKSNHVPYDFISTHHYPTDAFGKPGDDTVTQLADSRRSVLREEVIETRKKAGDTPVYYTEWSTSSNPFDEMHDMPYASAFITKTIIEARNNIQGYSYWTFSDIFEENYFSSLPYHGGFGLMTIHGIPKPAYRAYELLHRLGETFFGVEGNHPTVDVWVFKKENTFHVLITNFELPKHSIKKESITVELQNISSIKSCIMERIDDDHANARKEWIKMEKPGSLSLEQVKTLESASLLKKESLTYKSGNNCVALEVDLLPLATVLITLETE